MQTLTFHDTDLTIIDHAGQKWFTAGDISRALGYSKADKVSEIFNRYKAEFNGDLSMTLKLGVAGTNLKTDRRIFNRRGAHLIAMLAKTPRAAAFRKWVLDVLDSKHVALPATQTSGLPLFIGDKIHGMHITLIHCEEAMKHYQLLLDHKPVYDKDGPRRAEYWRNAGKAILSEVQADHADFRERLTAIHATKEWNQMLTTAMQM